MMSFVAETFIFLYVGMDALDIEKWKMSKLRYYSFFLYMQDSSNLYFRKLEIRFQVISNSLYSNLHIKTSK